MRKYQIHQIIEYIRYQTHFPFDAIEVEEQLDEILAHFGIRIILNTVERDEVRRYLRPRGVAFQVAESVRIRQQQQDYLMGVDVSVPDERALAQIRKAHMVQKAIQTVTKAGDSGNKSGLFGYRH